MAMRVVDGRRMEASAAESTPTIDHVPMAGTSRALDDMEAATVSPRVHGRGNPGAKPRGEAVADCLLSNKIGLAIE